MGIRPLLLVFSSLILQACVSPNGTLNFVDIAGNPSTSNELAWNGFTQIPIGSCTSYQISVPPSSSPTTVTLSASGLGSFFSNSSCTASISSTLVSALTNVQTVYYLSPGAGTATFTANASGLAPATYSVTVSVNSSAPTLNAILDQVFPSNAVAVGTAMPTVTFPVVASATYTCLFNQDLSSTFPNSCSSLTGLSLSGTAGTLNWTPSATSAWGAYKFQITATNSAGSASTSFTVDVFQGYTTAGLLFDFDAEFANMTGPASSSPTTTTWQNLTGGNSDGNGALAGFPTVGTGYEGWTGTGSSTDPYQLDFSGGQTVTFGSQLNSAPSMVTAWVRPTVLTGTATGTVIYTSNNNGVGTGMTIRQSAQFPSTYELETIGNYSYEEDVIAQPGLLGYWRLNDTSSVMQDASGQGNAGNYLLNGTPHAPAITGSGPLSGDSTSAGLSLPYATGPTYGNGATAIGIVAPQTYTEEIWFKTTLAYGQGGYLIGFGNLAGAPSTMSDRKIWMNNSGNIATEINNAGSISTSGFTTDAYNDGFWHQVVATFNANSMILALYVDGALCTSVQGSSFSAAANISNGFWRIGYDTLSEVPSPPTSFEFLGELSDASVSSTVLTADDVARHFALGNRRCHSAPITASSGWTFLGATYDNVTEALYVNGSEVCEAAFGSSGPTSATGINLTLGGPSPSNWYGAIADFKAYSTGDAADVLNIYNATSPRF